ncbi:velvet factor-domain-containing protein [Irpex lacteus]|nr:velvet factor-domain-containing protein [Irpex lacteus]
MARPPHQLGPLPGINELDTMNAPSRSLDFTKENIGRPVTFSEGPFAGMTIRAELIELQKADLGRKYARKDRRPLDPPPVVQLKIHHLNHQGTPFERFEEYDRYEEAQGLGLVCHIDLFPVPPHDDHPDPLRHQISDEGNPPLLVGRILRLRRLHRRLCHQLLHPLYPRRPIITCHKRRLVPLHSIFILPRTMVQVQVPPGPDAPEGVVAYLGDFAITEESKCTDALSGACFAQSQSLEYHGRKVLMFVFSDIAVRVEGTFILRYRVFNIYARAEGIDIPILAECYGGPFRIYSTKEFPGLRPSTDLTKHLSMFGVRLNLRETERKRRRGGPSSEAEGSGAPTRGRRRRRPHRAGGGGDDEDSDEGSGGGSGDEDD